MLPLAVPQSRDLAREGDDVTAAANVPQSRDSPDLLAGDADDVTAVVSELLPSSECEEGLPFEGEV